MKQNQSELLMEKVQRTMNERVLAGPDNPVLIMVSGGSDSTALAYIAHELFEAKKIGPLALLHVNHQLRGEDSDTDQAFVEQLANSLNIPLYTCEIDVAAQVGLSGENVEAAARHERYLAANEALGSLCLHKAYPLSEGRIFTAHTQDDRVENFYMRSIVGTGPGGFRSLLYRNGPIVRPFMDVSRNDLRSYILEREKLSVLIVCDQEGNLWREDATNAHTDKFRAYVRHKIIPLAKERNPQLLETLCRCMNLIADEDDMLEEQARQLVKGHVIWMKTDDDNDDYQAGCLIEPDFGASFIPLQRRACMQVLQLMLGLDARIETASIEAVLKAWDQGIVASGYTHNIQGDLAVSANKQGVRIEPMAAYRARRKRE